MLKLSHIYLPFGLLPVLLLFLIAFDVPSSNHWDITETDEIIKVAKAMSLVVVQLFHSIFVSFIPGSRMVILHF